MGAALFWKELSEWKLRFLLVRLAKREMWSRRQHHLPRMAFRTITQVSARRVTIRPVNESNLNDLFEINGDDAVTQFLPYPTWKTIEDGAAWLTRMEALALCCRP
jgi:hypothetical protein